MFGAPASDAWIHTLVDHWRGRQEWILAQQMTIAGIASPTGGEGARGAHIEAALRAIPAFAVSRDRYGNVCAVVSPHGHTAAPIVCMAHLDTVFDANTPLVVHRDHSMVRCPGIGDNSRGLAVLLALAHSLGDAATLRHLTRPVHLVATVGEEGTGDLRGARGWFDDRVDRERAPSAVIAIDGPGDDTIVHRAPGSVRLRIMVSGPGGHSWTDADTANPIHAIGHMVAGVERLSAQRPAGTTVAVTRIGGGESLTSIPTTGLVDIDIRGIQQDAVQQLRASVLSIASQAVRDESARHGRGPLTQQVTVLGERPAGAIGDHHPLVRAAIVATEQVGRTARPGIASTDANIPLSRGIPAIALGAGGSGGGAHTLDEWFDDRDSHRGVERLLRLVLRLATEPLSVNQLER
ncbi:MAG TPA: M20/M25/M40 family metallo-hydrolase [Gemmatimonas sp.]|uniref:M20/M25/M40 family metallo-hydrolase n=1 Tax=Gemmatimonas sp. TaxID=1962908 RepID=UPI002ED98E3C